MAINKREIIEQLRKLDERMIRLPYGQANTEFDILEVRYDELLKKLRRRNELAEIRG